MAIRHALLALVAMAVLSSVSMVFLYNTSWSTPQSVRHGGCTPCNECKLCEQCPPSPPARVCEACLLCSECDISECNSGEVEDMALRIAEIERNPGRVARLMGQGVWYGQGDASLSPKHKAIRAELLACAKTLNSSTLPDFDKLTSGSCSQASFVPWRRDSSAMRTLWCLMHRPDVNSFLDTFSDATAENKAAAAAAPKRVAGFELTRERAGAAAKLLHDYRGATVFHQSSLDQHTLQCDLSESHCKATGALADLCAWHKFDAAMVDSGAGTMWCPPEGSVYGSEPRETQELQVVRDMCRPRYLFMVNTNMHPEKVVFLRWLEDHPEQWVPILRGASRGVGCGDTQSALRDWMVFYYVGDDGPPEEGYGRMPESPRDVIPDLACGEGRAGLSAEMHALAC